MSIEPPALTIRFTWDSVAGIFWGELPSGARFSVDRSHIGGKLEANLNLFRQAVTPKADGRRITPSKEGIRKEIENLPESQVRKFKPDGKVEVEIDLSDLDISEL